MISLLSFASLHDLASRRIPNWMPLTLALVALATHALDGTLLPALIGGAIVFTFAYLCWRGRWLGGGDVKLLAAAALAVPPGLVATYLLTVALTGGALALLYLLLSAKLRALPLPPRPARLLPRILRAELWRLRHHRPSLPYACAIAGGAFLTLLGN